MVVAYLVEVKANILCMCIGTSFIVIILVQLNLSIKVVCEDLQCNVEVFFHYQNFENLV